MRSRLQDRDDGDLKENHDINVTPFIDVMLVLLIIFMVAAPLSTVDVPVELPVAVSDPVQRPADPVFVTIRSDLTLAVGEDVTDIDDLHIKVGVATRQKRDVRLYIRVDKSVAYGQFMRVMNVLRADGYLKIGLVGLDEDVVMSGNAPSSEGMANGTADAESKRL